MLYKLSPLQGTSISIGQPQRKHFSRQFHQEKIGRMLLKFSLLRFLVYKPVLNYKIILCLKKSYILQRYISYARLLKTFWIFDYRRGCICPFTQQMSGLLQCLLGALSLFSLSTCCVRASANVIHFTFIMALPSLIKNEERTLEMKCCNIDRAWKSVFLILQCFILPPPFHSVWLSFLSQWHRSVFININSC